VLDFVSHGGCVLLLYRHRIIHSDTHSRCALAATAIKLRPPQERPKHRVARLSGRVRTADGAAHVATAVGPLQPSCAQFEPANIVVEAHLPVGLHELLHRRRPLGACFDSAKVTLYLESALIDHLYQADVPIVVDRILP